jgi:hypothetical protein
VSAASSRLELRLYLIDFVNASATALKRIKRLPAAARSTPNSLQLAQTHFFTSFGSPDLSLCTAQQHPHRFSLHLVRSPDSTLPHAMYFKAPAKMESYSCSYDSSMCGGCQKSIGSGTFCKELTCGRCSSAS